MVSVTNTPLVRSLIAELARASEGRIRPKRLLPIAQVAGYSGSARYSLEPCPGWRPGAAQRARWNVILAVIRDRCCDFVASAGAKARCHLGKATATTRRHRQTYHVVRAAHPVRSLDSPGEREHRQAA